MPSRADGRRLAEWALRAVVFGALALALWRSLRPVPRVGVHSATDASGLASALRRASVSADVGALDAALSEGPSRVQRDWLRALRRSGVDVSWHGSPPGLAMEVERTAEPTSRVRVALAGTERTLALADSGGALDSVTVSPNGAVLESPAIVGVVSVGSARYANGAQGAANAATSTVPAERAPRAIMVLGRAGWESKFVSAALQEAGWTVRARATVAPGVVITDPSFAPLDTSRYDAVVALDSTAAAMQGDIARFVRAGGGLVLAGDAVSLEQLRALAPARGGARTPGRILMDGDSVTRADLPLRQLVAVRNDAVRLDGTPSQPLLTVRRAGLGRVASVAYDATWRWRMLGGVSGAAAHRDWWSRTLSLVAPSGPATVVTRATDAAPLAALFDALGAPRAARAMPNGNESRPELPLTLLALIALALLAELASRRFRGAR